LDLGSRSSSVLTAGSYILATWRDTARVVGARSAEIARMASAFEHDDLKRALAL